MSIFKSKKTKEVEPVREQVIEVKPEEKIEAEPDGLEGILDWRGMQREYKKLRSGNYAYIVICMEQYLKIYGLFGFTAGDMNVASVVDALRRRIGGGELICRDIPNQVELILEMQDEEQLVKRVETLLEKLNSIKVTDGVSQYSYPRAFSCGIFEMQGSGEDLLSARDMAALAMRTSRQRKTPYEIYKKNLQEESNLLKKLLADSAGAMERQEFVPYFHPKYDLNTGRIVGADVLARWQHPEQGLIMPNTFIPLLQQNGNIAELDIYMLEQACKLIKKWTENEAMPVPLSVNLSPLNIYKSDFTERIIKMVEKYKTEPCLLELEMDEESLFENSYYLKKYSLILKDAGFVLCMDNFGCGCTSLRLLTELPVSLIKMDKQFLRGENVDKKTVILKNVVQMARELGITIVAGGIETPQQVDILKRLRCNQGMGFLFSKPMTLSAFETLTL